MNEKNVQTESKFAIIDPSRFPKAPELTAAQIQEMSDGIAACERGEGIDGDEFIDQIPE